jgi:hypothetical protein
MLRSPTGSVFYSALTGVTRALVERFFKYQNICIIAAPLIKLGFFDADL